MANGDRGPGRFEPDSATGRMNAARNHRARAYAERNKLIEILAARYESHLMPPSGGLASTVERRGVVCVHLPVVGQVHWLVSAEEVKAHFGHMKRIADNHWDHSTRAERDDRLTQFAALLRAEHEAGPKKAGKPGKRTQKNVRSTKRRPGDFSRPRSKGR
jgi:hypothetical protein